MQLHEGCLACGKPSERLHGRGGPLTVAEPRNIVLATRPPVADCIAVSKAVPRACISAKALRHPQEIHA